MPSEFVVDEDELDPSSEDKSDEDRPVELVLIANPTQYCYRKTVAGFTPPPRKDLLEKLQDRLRSLVSLLQSRDTGL